MKRLTSVDGNHSQMLTSQLAISDDFDILNLSVKKCDTRKGFATEPRNQFKNL